MSSDCWKKSWSHVNVEQCDVQHAQRCHEMIKMCINYHWFHQRSHACDSQILWLLMQNILGYSLKKTATTLKHASSWDVYQVLCALYVLVWNVGQCKVKQRTESPNRVPGRVFLRETLAPKQKRSELQTRLITAEILRPALRGESTHILLNLKLPGLQMPTHTHQV